jgi:hypothetical protein
MVPENKVRCVARDCQHFLPQEASRTWSPDERPYGTAMLRNWRRGGGKLGRRFGGEMGVKAP